MSLDNVDLATSCETTSSQQGRLSRKCSIAYDEQDEEKKAYLAKHSNTIEKDNSSATQDPPCTFDIQILRESLKDVEKTAQEKLRGGTEVKSFSDLFCLDPMNSEDDTRTRGGAPNGKPRGRRPGGVMTRKNTGTAALKAAAEHVASVKTPGALPLPKQLLLYLVRMGSFTSMPKVAPSPDAEDDDLDYPDEKESVSDCLDRCSKHLQHMPEPIQRSWTKVEEEKEVKENEEADGEEKIRVLQWNVLSQALGTKNDNFVRCPTSALEWKTRRFRMLEEIVRHEADVICLQEVDHFAFLKKSLAPLGYEGYFYPKPDSPCLYLPDNTGPDGCAIFFKSDKFELKRLVQRVVEVWHVESNQVVLLACLRSKRSQDDLYVATTHLKARNGALLSTLRNEQGKDIVNFISEQIKMDSASDLSKVAVICTGDFNAEPNEPVYKTMTDNMLGLSSAYSSTTGHEPSYTTWKIREDGEHIQTLDYVFHSDNRLRVNAILDFPNGDDIGPGRIPSNAYASDHFSLVVDFTLTEKTDGTLS